MTIAHQIPVLGTTAQGESIIPNACRDTARTSIAGCRTPQKRLPKPRNTTTTTGFPARDRRGVKAEGVTAGETAPQRGVENRGTNPNGGP